LVRELDLELVRELDLELVRELDQEWGLGLVMG